MSQIITSIPNSGRNNVNYGNKNNLFGFEATDMTNLVNKIDNLLNDDKFSVKADSTFDRDVYQKMSYPQTNSVSNSNFGAKYQPTKDYKTSDNHIKLNESYIQGENLSGGKKPLDALLREISKINTDLDFLDSKTYNANHTPAQAALFPNKPSYGTSNSQYTYQPQVQNSSKSGYEVMQAVSYPCSSSNYQNSYRAQPNTEYMPMQAQSSVPYYKESKEQDLDSLINNISKLSKQIWNQSAGSSQTQAYAYKAFEPKENR